MVKRLRLVVGSILVGLLALLALSACLPELEKELAGYLTDRPEPTPRAVSESSPGSAYKMLATLEHTDLPQSDLAVLARRLSKVGEVPLVVRDVPYDYQLGAEERFWALDTDTDQNFEVLAVLQVITPHLYLWVEKGAAFDLAALQASAERFETQTYPTNRSYFGSEWSPGVDGDVHLNVLHLHRLGSGVGGYYSSADEFSRVAHAYSNEREMFYVNLDTVTLGGDYYDGLLAHEFQHMIHWYADRNEDLWISEGLSELAAYLNNFDPGSAEYDFLAQPDLQLNDFAYDDPSGMAHYGASYLFNLYFLERFGPEATRLLVANPANGPAGFDAVLEQLGQSLRFEDLFADWVVALYLDRPELDAGRFGFQGIDLPAPALSAEYAGAPAGPRDAAVKQFGVDYIRLAGDSPVTVILTGTRQVRLVGVDPHSGDSFVWSNRGDEINTSLTRAFDLSGLERATLDFWLWYEIEEGWDYAYLEVSTDGGQTWDIIPAANTSANNPTGNNYGDGFTGRSGGGSAPQWIHELVDLSAYAGRSILLRFDYITDGAIHESGLALDDLSIPELGFSDGFEGDDPAWELAGFVRSNNVLPQKYVLQLIELGAKPRITRLALDAEGRGRWTIPLDAETKEAVLAVSGATPVTLEPASYSYRIDN